MRERRENGRFVVSSTVEIPGMISSVVEHVSLAKDEAKLWRRISP